MAVAVMSAVVALAYEAEFARAEFAKYHKLVTGREPAANILQLKIDASVSSSGNDAFAIRSDGSGVTITGSNGRSLIYGAYELLEQRAGCRWFWDGDVVPKRETINLSGLDIKDEAQFEYRGLRYFAHRGLTRFQAEHWGLEDWKKELDWCLKKRLNTFMLRIGQDDLFQRTFPETCEYPDPSKDLRGHGTGYNNRSLFWSLEYRGKLREEVQKYGRERGMMIPEDFGTMTHWYSRTPEDFLEKKNPPFLPQSTKGYSEKNGLVWDIRDQKWADEYWKLTTAAVKAYGGGKPELLHTIGLGERRCFTNRTDNFNLKLQALDTFIGRARRDYPDAKILLGGWDFYFTWHPDEVKELVSRLNPEHVIIWDYEGDAVTDYRSEMQGLGNNFTKWGVVGKFPYTYSVFLAFENALDMRANYPLIECRQKVVQNDPMCKGYIFWPESSHTDTLLLEHFAVNAWKRGGESIDTIMPRFCRDRYGDQSAQMEKITKAALPMSSLLDWSGNYGVFTMNRRTRFRNLETTKIEGFKTVVRVAPLLLRELAKIDVSDPMVLRDVIDLARMLTDRSIISVNGEMLTGYETWRNGKGDGARTVAFAEALAKLGGQMARLLAQHTDYSVWESFERLDAIEKVKNPNIPQVLLDNASNGYCMSHQYECAEYWYRPAISQMCAEIVRNIREGKKASLSPADKSWSERLNATPLSAMRPVDVRSAANLRAILSEIAATLDGAAGDL